MTPVPTAARTGLRRERLLNLRYYRQHPKARAAFYRRYYGLLASLRRNLRARKRRSIAAWFAAVFAAIFARQLASRYVSRPRSEWQTSKESPVIRRHRKGGGRQRRVRYQAALRMLFRAARRQRYGVSLGRDVFTSDDRRKLRNARKAERRAS